MATRTGTVSKTCSDPPGFTLVPDDPPPLTLPFSGVTDRQYATALAAWSSGKKVTVTFPDGGGVPTKVEGV